MALGDDIKNAAQNFGGKGKESVGKATGDQELESEGKGDQAAATVKKAVSDVTGKLRGK